MTGLLSGRAALVTGAGSAAGIGFATAKLFVEAGARVALADLDGSAVRERAAELGPAAIGLTLDVRDRDACERAAAATEQAFGRLDVLVTSAGVVQTRRLAEVSPSDLEAVLGVNLVGTLNVVQAAAPRMAAAGGGAIVCIASIAAQRGGGLMGGPHYAASKGGVLALVKATARELGPHGIRVNAVNPGVILTDMNRDAFDAGQRSALVAGTPLGRLGAPADVAGACLFLASDLSAYVTGTETDVNGGMHIH